MHHVLSLLTWNIGVACALAGGVSLAACTSKPTEAPPAPPPAIEAVAPLPPPPPPVVAPPDPVQPMPRAGKYRLLADFELRGCVKHDEGRGIAGGRCLQEGVKTYRKDEVLDVEEFFWDDNAREFGAKVVVFEQFRSIPVKHLAAHIAPGEGPRFACDDSQARADGKTLKSECVLHKQYCYEASGGAAVSHGAVCRPLPVGAVSCEQLAQSAGGSCWGTAATGLRVSFAYP